MSVLVNSARELHGAAAVVVATWPLRGPFLQLAVKVAIAVDWLDCEAAAGVVAGLPDWHWDVHHLSVITIVIDAAGADAVISVSR